MQKSHNHVLDWLSKGPPKNARALQIPSCVSGVAPVTRNGWPCKVTGMVTALGQLASASHWPSSSLSKDGRCPLVSSFPVQWLGHGGILPVSTYWVLGIGDCRGREQYGPTSWKYAYTLFLRSSRTERFRNTSLSSSAGLKLGKH